MRRLLTLSAVLVATAAPALAQQGGMNMPPAPPAGRVSPAPSPRATATVTLSNGVRGSTPMKIVIDYGQPFARGRAVEGGLIPAGQVWRTGANSSTNFTTDVNLRVGTLTVPKGAYTLYSLYTPGTGLQLIINKQTGQWGTEYKPEMDLGRVAMTTRALSDAHDAFVIALEPSAATTGPATMKLTLTWGKSEFSVPVTVQP